MHKAATDDEQHTIGEIADVMFDHNDKFGESTCVNDVNNDAHLTLLQEEEMLSERGAIIEETLVARNHSQATDESGVNISSNCDHVD